MGTSVRDPLKMLMEYEFLKANNDSLDTEIIEQIDEMNRYLSEHPKKDLYGASAFWELLGNKHKMLIKKYGFKKFKQTINFEYFQYNIKSLRDKKILSLLVRLLKEFRVPYGMFLAKVDAKKCLENVPKISSDQSFNPRIYSIYMGLLWQYVLMKDLVGCLNICDEPLIGEPIPVNYKGKLISQDLAISTLELNSIAKHIDMSKIKKVAEIGAGYGRLAYVAVMKYREMEYCIFDIPPALAICQNYLAMTMGQKTVQKFLIDADSTYIKDHPTAKIKAFLPHELESFPDGYFDLVINISSFDEMQYEQVENYFSLIDKKCKGWLYVKGHETKPKWCKVSGGGLLELPYKTEWKLEYHGKDQFITNFIERIYSLHPKVTQSL